MVRTLIDRLTAHAVTAALDPIADHDAVIDDLVVMADHSEHALRLTLARIRRAAFDRPSETANRAGEIVCQAMEQLAGDLAGRVA